MVVLNPHAADISKLRLATDACPRKRYGSASRRATLVTEALPTARRSDDQCSRTTRADNLVAGEWVPAITGRTYERRNPAARSDLLGHFPHSGRADVAAAAEAARSAFAAWSARRGVERATVLAAAAELALERADEIARDMTCETGKPVREARAEAARLATTLRYFAADAWFPHGEVYGQSLTAGQVYTLRRPAGRRRRTHHAMELPAGDTGVEAGARARRGQHGGAQALRGGASECDAPRPVPRGRRVAPRRAEHGDRSRRRGRRRARHPARGARDLLHWLGGGGSAHARRRDGARQADTTRTRRPEPARRDGRRRPATGRRSCVRGAFFAAGQKCTATRRLFVQQDVYDEFRERLLERTSRAVIGDPTDPRTELGPLINRRQYDTVLEAIEQGRRQGGELLAGGEHRGDDGYFVSPTLFENVDDAAELAREEVFGPVASLFCFATLDEAVARANDVEYGLSASIFTSALATAQRFVGAAQAGVIHVNSTTTGAEVYVPFGGIKASGWGPHEQGRAAIEFYTDAATVYLDA